MFDRINNYNIYNTELTNGGEVVIVTSKDKKSCTIVLTNDEHEIEQSINLPIKEDMVVFFDAVSGFRSILEDEGVL